MYDIMIADDEHLEREVLKHVINDISGVRVVGESGTGKPAVEYCASLMPNLVFLNHAFGGSSGMDDAWKIRKNDQRIVIVLTTVDERFLVRQDFSAMNINEILLKPIRPSVIDEIVRKYVSAHETETRLDAVGPKKMTQNRSTNTESKAKTKEVSAALRYINSYFRENISLEDVADAVYLSSYYLSRLFKKEVGVNFSSYLLCMKLDEAKRLLRETEMPILSISSSLSFSDPSYFCKVFKKYTNSTPKEFRRQ